MEETDLKTVAAVERALSVLDAFRDGERFLSLAELSDRTGLYKSTILRLVQTLLAAGYLGQDQNGKYYIGPAVFRLSRFYQAAVTPPGLIVPVLQALVDASAESAGFQVRAGDQRMCLYRVDSPQRLRDNVSPGDLLPLDRGAGGRVILAFSGRHDPRYEPIRKRLVVSTAGETAKGMAGVAAPVFGSEGFVGALTISGPEFRFDKTAIEKFETLLLKAAQDVTTRLGGDPGIFGGRRPNVARARPHGTGKSRSQDSAA